MGDPELKDMEKPQVADEHLRRAYEFEERGELRESLAECEGAIKIARSFLADAYNLRGIVLEGLGQNEEAVESYRQALSLEPGFGEAADNLRELEMELGVKHDLVTVMMCRNTAEAYGARAKLESEGIGSFIADEYAVGAIGLGVGALGGIRLQTRESDVERALEVLGTQAEEEEELRCPGCGSGDVRAPLLGKEWRCRECGHRWEL
jgi:tetratricopeptide (TPR) repeat protein